MHVKSTYTVKKWEEKPYEEISPEMKMTKAFYNLKSQISNFKYFEKDLRFEF